MKAMFALSLFLVVSSLAVAEEYSDPGGFTVTFPKDWAMRTQMHGVNVMAAPKTTDKNIFIQNANIMTDHLGSKSLDEYFDASMKRVQESVADFKLEDSGSTKVNGRDAKWAVYQATIKGVSGKILQYMIRNGKQVVLVTAVDSLDQFNAHRATLETIATSLNFEREIISPQRDASASMKKRESMPQNTVSKPQMKKQIFQSAPGDADMPARLYYEK